MDSVIYEHPKVEPPARALSVNRDRGVLTLWGLAQGPTPEYNLYFKERVYAVSVGLEGYETPGGQYCITTAARNPDWKVPDSDWARELGLTPGVIVPGGDPSNPLKKRWLGVTPPSGGIGIHGTAARDRLGEPASHGCIRMRPQAIIELFDLVPIGTPIFIA
jgi:lipoprotein-anchoring transpeptidase ErfK/SrfK